MAAKKKASWDNDAVPQRPYPSPLDEEQAHIKTYEDALRQIGGLIGPGKEIRVYLLRNLSDARDFHFEITDQGRPRSLDTLLAHIARKLDPEATADKQDGQWYLRFRGNPLGIINHLAEALYGKRTALRTECIKKEQP